MFARAATVSPTVLSLRAAGVARAQAEIQTIRRWGWQRHRRPVGDHNVSFSGSWPKGLDTE